MNTPPIEPDSESSTPVAARFSFGLREAIILVALVAVLALVTALV